jgi:hypothetical protein
MSEFEKATEEQIRQEVLAQIKAENREYMRKWRAKNKDKVKAKNERYILKKADSLKNKIETN